LGTGNLETACTAPSARTLLKLAIALFFKVDQKGGKLVIQSAPGISDFRGDGITQHFANRCQQAFTDNRVLLGKNA